MKEFLIKKLTSIGMVLLCCALLLSGCFFDNDEKSYDSLKKSFEKDLEAVDAAVQNGSYDDAAELKWIKKVDVNERYVDFYCGGSGFGSQTDYTGFFYTEDDDPLAMWRGVVNSVVSPNDFVKTEDGWEYIERDHHEGGDNIYIVKQLAPCYYYYYLHF